MSKVEGFIRLLLLDVNPLYSSLSIDIFVMFSNRYLLTVLLLAAALGSSESFQSTVQSSRCASSRSVGYRPQSSLIYQQNNDDDELIRKDGSTRRGNGRLGIRKFLRSKLKKKIAVVVASSALIFGSAAIPKVSHASAPVIAVPKAEARDPIREAFDEHDRRMTQKAQEELRQFTLKARQIEAKHGEAAREKFEAEYKENQQKEAQAKKDGLVQLKRDLLDKGICPFVDLEGRRQVTAWEKGVDLGEVPGTQFYLEKQFEQSNPQKSWNYRKAPNREIIKCMVEDMKNRDIDPLQYFESHTDKTADILDLPAAQAAQMATKYKANIETYGQIVPPKEGEQSAKEKLAQKAKSPSTDKAEAKRLKAEAKAKAAAEKAEAKAKAAEEKAAAKARAAEEKATAKAEAAAAKEAAKRAKEDAKKADTLAASGAAVASASASSAAEVAGSVASAASDGVTQQPQEDLAEDDGVRSDSEPVEAAGVASATVKVSSKKKGGLPIVPVSTFLVAAGGGGYAIKVLRERSAEAEEERQRQFKLLMGQLGDDAPSGAPALEVDDADLSSLTFDDENSRKEEGSEDSKLIPEQPTPKKRKRAFFGGKKSDRETDINNLVGSDAKAPEFSKTLAKILTFGAPGRFPGVVALPGAMPLQEFSLEEAQKVLIDTQTQAGLSREESAEVFANVVNCMLIDIVDLASSSLKEKDSKLTVDAVSIVVDFMNHAASLYNSIAEGVVITPVTYGGDLGKNKLEQMYSAYAASGMTNFANVDDDFQNRVSLLQDVFQIAEKKAEGLMMKAMQKSMMEMLKSGEGLEGMEEMMKGMGDMMPGMGLDGDADISPEQLKEMLTELKKLKDSGAIPPAELEQVKAEFQKSFGASLNDIVKDSDGSNPEEEEILALMKDILDS